MTPTLEIKPSIVRPIFDQRHQSPSVSWLVGTGECSTRCHLETRGAVSCWTIQDTNASTFRSTGRRMYWLEQENKISGVVCTRPAILKSSKDVWTGFVIYGNLSLILYTAIRHKATPTIRSTGITSKSRTYVSTDDNAVQ